MPEIVVAAQTRGELGKNANRRLRAAGRIPGVVYATGKAAVSVSVSPKEIGAVLKSAAGENTIFELELDGERRKVILQEYQVEPLRGQLLHADFYEVALDKPIEVKVPVELVGTPVGVKVEGGLLDFITRELDIVCLPALIPNKITVDVSALQIGKHLRVADVALPDGVSFVSEPELVVAHVVVKRAEVLPEAAPEAAPAGEEAAAAAEPEVAKRGKGEPEVAKKGKAEPEVARKGKGEAEEK